jgi:hypothetical protein
MDVKQALKVTWGHVRNMDHLEPHVQEAIAALRQAAAESALTAERSNQSNRFAELLSETIVTMAISLAGEIVSAASRKAAEKPADDLPKTQVEMAIELAGREGMDLENLFSVRIINCLEAEGIMNIGDLVQRTARELLEIRNFGRRSLYEVTDVLMRLNLRLKGSPPSSPCGRPRAASSSYKVDAAIPQKQ